MEIAIICLTIVATVQALVLIALAPFIWLLLSRIMLLEKGLAEVDESLSEHLELDPNYQPAGLAVGNGRMTRT